MPDQKVVGLIGTLNSFDENHDEFALYIERLEQYFAANDIDDKKKTAVFISVLGAKTYKLLRNLLQPKLPKACTYDELVTTLSTHFTPAPIVIAERFRFHKRNQEPGEAVSTFLVELKRLASTCAFGQFLEEAVRDRFVCGLRCEATQKRLLAKRELKLSEATEIAVAMELAEKDASNIHVPDQAAHKVRKQYANSKAQAKKSTFKCFRCGAAHTADKCKYKNAKCHGCGKIGHILPVCKSKDKTAKMVSAGEIPEVSDLHLFQIKSVNKVSEKSFTVPVKICNKPINMELDTAADISLISESWYVKSIPEATLKSTSTVLRDYNGREIEILGQVNVPVCYENQNKTLPLVVVKGDRPALFGKDWITQFKLNWKKIFAVKNEPCIKLEAAINDLKKSYDDLFKESDEPISHFKAKLKVKENCDPLFCKARPVPYSIKEKVSTEINQTKDRGVWDFVEHSSWATPLVIVPKKNGEVRLCGDFKITINKILDPNQYPLPTQQDLFSTLNGGKFFTKLDLSHAYQQVELDEESQEYLTLNTHLGLVRPRRLLYGISSAASVFQSIIERIVQGLKFVIVFQDDILITGSTFSEHLENVKRVFDRLRKYKVKLNLKKCEFAKSSVEFLGHRIDSEGVHPTDEKIKAIVSIKSPTNVTELKSFLGLLNYYAKFIKNASMILAPLYELLHADTPWQWTHRHEETFQKCKGLLTSNAVLVHYNEKLPIKLSCDASPLGLGVVLSHYANDEERPIAYASRTLTKAEKNYSQLEKEASAIIFGVKKFHQYIYGRQFTIVTDHKPLITIFGFDKSIPAMAAARLQRWAILLSSFQYQIEYKKGIEHTNADALSRIPLCHDMEEVEIFKVSYCDDLPISSIEIAKATRNDALLGTVLKYVQYGWPKEVSDEKLKPFSMRQHELSVDCNCLLWGMRVIIPDKFRSRLLNLLHDAHPGVARMKALARCHFWWPLLDRDIENMAKQCSSCQENARLPPVAHLQSWIWAKAPWERVHVDFGQKENRNYFIIVDSHSKWLEVIEMKSTASRQTIEVLQCLFARYGLPLELVSDNGPPFKSDEFESFLKSNGVKHTPIPPYRPKSNGLAERAVQTFKQALKKMNSDPNDHTSLNQKIFRFLMTYRSTPHTTTGISPAELFLGRPIRTLLSLVHPVLSEKVTHQQLRQKQNHDRSHTQNRTFMSDQHVWIYSYRQRKWFQGQLTNQCGRKTWTAKVNNSNVLVHEDQIRPAVKVPDSDPPEGHSSNYFWYDDDKISDSEPNDDSIVPRRNPARNRRAPIRLDL